MAVFNELLGIAKWRLPALQRVPTQKLNEIVHRVVASVLTTTISELHHLMYCAAFVATDMCGYNDREPGKIPNNQGVNQPKWKNDLILQIRKLQGDLSQLKALKDSRLICE